MTVFGPFSGSGFHTANVSGGTEGKPETGDSVSFDFNNARSRHHRPRLEPEAALSRAQAG